MISTYIIIFYHFVNWYISFLKINETYLHAQRNPKKFHLKMESDEKAAASVVALLLDIKQEKEKKIRKGKTLTGEEN